MTATPSSPAAEHARQRYRPPVLVPLGAMSTMTAKVGATGMWDGVLIIGMSRTA
ncbi:MAG: hypothetical protein K2X99_03820 [Gemmatimonadaceae bacterium]|nr:hypothetical protein [Gemmatimonadaceae bacterium]